MWTTYRVSEWRGGGWHRTKRYRTKNTHVLVRLSFPPLARLTMSERRLERRNVQPLDVYGTNKRLSEQTEPNPVDDRTETECVQRTDGRPSSTQDSEQTEWQIARAELLTYGLTWPAATHSLSPVLLRVHLSQYDPNSASPYNSNSRSAVRVAGTTLPL